MKKKVTPTVCERIQFIKNRIKEILVDMLPENKKEYGSLLNEFDSIRGDYDLFDSVFEENGKTGVVDVTGRIIVPAIYKDCPELFAYTPFESLPMAVCNFDDKYALVAPDGLGTQLCGFEYDAITFIRGSRNFYICEKKIGEKSLFGVLDSNGELIVPCEMDELEDPSDRVGSTYLYFTKGNKIGFLTMGGCYIEPQFDDADICPKFLYVRKGDVGGFLSVDGEFIEENDKEKIKNKELLTYWSMNDYVHELLDGYEGLV